MNPQAKLLRKITKEAEEYVGAKNQLKNNIAFSKMGNLALLQNTSKLFTPITSSVDSTTATLNRILDKQEDISKKLQAALQYPPSPIVQSPRSSIASESPAPPEHTTPRIASPIIQQAITEYSSRPLLKTSTKQSSSSTTMRLEGTLEDGSPYYSLNSSIFIINKDQLEEIDRITEQPVLSYTISPNIAEILFNPNPLDKEYHIEELGQYLKVLRGSGKEPTNSGGKMKSIYAQLTSIMGITAKPRLDALPAFGEGVPTVFLSSDPKLLVKRLMVLLGSKKAGNNNTRNEAVSIMDHLLQTDAMSKDYYKRLYDEFWA
jgi:hypothetical protein